MWDNFACATAIFSTHFITSIAVLENVLPDAGLQKRATFSTLNIGMAETGNQTRSTCVASSGTNRLAIHYALSLSIAWLRKFVLVCNKFQEYILNLTDFVMT
jgi:hypothetical protein